MKFVSVMLLWASQAVPNVST